MNCFFPVLELLLAPLPPPPPEARPADPGEMVLLSHLLAPRHAPTTRVFTSRSGLTPWVDWLWVSSATSAMRRNAASMMRVGLMNASLRSSSMPTARLYDLSRCAFWRFEPDEAIASAARRG